jgi:hypothetical protein
MQVKEVAKMLGGSVAIYVVIAACSAASTPQRTSSEDGGGGSGSGGASGASSRNSADGSGSGRDGPSILDALTDPVPAANADPNQSGTRLKMNYYAGADGSKQSAGTLHDSQLNVDCTFTTASDGTLRCLPANQGLLLTYYADAACTQQIVLVYKGCGAPGYALTTAGSSVCVLQPTTHVFALSGPYSGTSYYTKSGTMCSGPVPVASLTMSYDLYSSGAEQPPSTFVQAALRSEP